MDTDIPHLDFLFCALAGAAGGLVCFLLGVRNQHYKNNRYLTKFGLEILGGGVTASGLVYVFRENPYIIVIAFVIGTAWAKIIQSIRAKITDIVVAALKASGDVK
jgi:hypothetical protein